MSELAETRRTLKIALIAMVCADVAAVALLVSPLVGSSESRQQQIQQLTLELHQKTKQVEPLKGLDQKVVVASQQVDQFYNDRVPARGSSIPEELGKLASQNGVKLAQAKYETKDPEAVGLSPVLIEANCQGDYLQLVRFINALERDKTFFIVTSVVLGDAQGGSVKLQLKLESYVRTGA